MKVIIFMPAYNAEKTLEEVWRKIPQKYKKNTFLIDDNSKDNTYETAKKLGIESYKNKTNLGYGGNVKACLQKALKKDADIIVEMHPDNEYDPSSIEQAVKRITPFRPVGATEGQAGMILGNRENPVQSGMHIWKYIPSKLLTAFDNFILGTNLSDLHQGFRVYTKQMLEKASFKENSNNYLFSFEIICQTMYHGFTIGEVPVKTNYTGKKRGANLKNSILYTLGTFNVLLFFLLAKAGMKNKIFT